jgi:SAM-dependent methyltransferase
MREVFSTIYENNEWKMGSGEGSLPEFTTGYRKFLQRFLKRYKIASVVDLGCGDWQFSRLMDWKGIDYLGVDIVDSVIEENKKKFEEDRIKFVCSDIRDFQGPGADLIIIKDVLQHWSNAEILRFIPRLRDYKYGLITNCAVSGDQKVNGEIEDGAFRPIDLRKDPFNLQCSAVYKFSKPTSLVRSLFQGKEWEKTVFLLRS